MLAEFCRPLAEHPLEHGNPALPMTLTNFYRFAPLFKYYSKRFESKIRQKLNIPKAETLVPTTIVSPRIQLWETDEVREILNVKNMVFANFADNKSLSDFLSRSKEIEFGYNEQWQRLLSLEFALRKLGDPRRFKKFPAPSISVR